MEGKLSNIRCLVAVNGDGKYFGLKETQHTTSPFVTDDPLEAKRFGVNSEDDLFNPHEATYYFENSDRMRYWLKGFKAIPIEISTVTKYNFIK
jgi:hypothetical protein